jgi:hypothetical protein
MTPERKADLLESLRDWAVNDPWFITTSLSPDFEEAADLIETLTREIDEAHKYAERLATLLCEKHFKEVAPHWKPLPDTVGIITQIDNMTCGIEEKAEARGYRRGVEDAAKQIDGVLEARRLFSQFTLKLEETSETYFVLENLRDGLLALLEQTSDSNSPHPENGTGDSKKR